jgi:hypothetical protein
MDVTRTDPLCPGNMTTGIRVALHLSDGAHIWTLAAHRLTKGAILVILMAKQVLLQIPTMGHATPGTTRRVRIWAGTPLMSPHLPVAPRMWMPGAAMTMRPIFPKGDRLFHPAIGIGANLLIPLGIALLMPLLLLVRNITGINGGTILSLPRSFPVVDIGTRAGRSLSTAMILFSSTAGLWMHGKIAAHNSVVRRWICGS